MLPFEEAEKNQKKEEGKSRGWDGESVISLTAKSTYLTHIFFSAIYIRRFIPYIQSWNIRQVTRNAHTSSLHLYLTKSREQD